MKSLIKILFLLVSSTLIAQSITYNNLNDKVTGIVYRGNTKYLVTENGYIKLPTEKRKSVNNQWTEYYRKAYGDSTIQNPNTIIEQPGLDIPISFFLPVGGRTWFDGESDFNDNFYLYDFIKRDENGQYVFRPGIIGVIGRLQTHPQRK